MKLYDGGRAPNPRRVRIFLAEKGISVPLEQIDLGKLEHKDETFTAINPVQQIPVLILDDGTAISETIAICRYFEEVQPEPALFGAGAVGRATVEMWQRRLELDLLIAVAQVFRHTHPAMATMEVPQVPDWGHANRARVEKFLLVLDGHLASREFVCGDAFTVADITGFIAIDFMKPAKLTVPDSFTHVRRWYDAVAARPSAKA